MKKITLSLLAIFTLLTLNSFADQVITLKDGSQIKGDLVGIQNGTYTVKTPIIGEVHVSANDVASISNPVAGGTPPATTTVSTTPATDPNLVQKVQAAQAQVMSNPEAMADIQALAQDPDIAPLLTDPELVRLVTSHDAAAIAANPKAQALMNNPKMRALIEKLQAQGISAGK